MEGYLLDIGIVVYMAITSGYAGGSLPGSKVFDRINATWLPEALFALGMMGATFPAFGPWCVLAGLWCYGWQQSATSLGLHWGKGGYNPSRTSTLKPFVDWIAGKLGYDPSTVQYCRLFMGVRGFLITLPVGGLGAIFYPLGYEIGNRVNNHAVSECLSGAGAGISIMAFWALT